MRATSSLRCAVCLVAAMLLLNGSSLAVAGFEGDVITAWLKRDTQGNAREMELKEPFAYIDSTGFRWSVPAGTKVDGASIPQIFWTIAGAPFVGPYRRASVVHDHYCKVKTQPWQRVHRMFYEASVADGTSVTRAKIMYAAVYAGGPRWPTPGQLGAKVEPNPKITDEEFLKLEKWIEANQPSLSEIEDKLREF